LLRPISHNYKKSCPAGTAELWIGPNDAAMPLAYAAAERSQFLYELLLCNFVGLDLKSAAYLHDSFINFIFTHVVVPPNGIIIEETNLYLA
jgi:hypothetical protein